MALMLFTHQSTHFSKAWHFRCVSVCLCVYAIFGNINPLNACWWNEKSTLPFTNSRFQWRKLHLHLWIKHTTLFTMNWPNELHPIWINQNEICTILNCRIFHSIDMVLNQELVLFFPGFWRFFFKCIIWFLIYKLHTPPSRLTGSSFLVHSNFIVEALVTDGSPFQTYFHTCFTSKNRESVESIAALSIDK